MLRTIDLRSSHSASVLPAHSPVSDGKTEAVVRDILRKVEAEGDEALRFYARKFDGVTLKSISVPEKEIFGALAGADAEFVKILRSSARNIRAFHQHQVRSSWSIPGGKGSTLRQRIQPVQRAGVYVPGGKAAYPSTVLMNVIPAQVAGVDEICLVSPPDKRGKVHRDVLAAAAVLGIRKIFCVGGAQAIAALAFGTRTIPRVDVIVGPGNVFVAAAKRMVFGLVGIDAVAGPSEIVILADKTANPDFLAADMLAQSEHDESASSILVTPSSRLIADVEKCLAKYLRTLPRAEMIKKALRRNGKAYRVKDLAQGVELVNRIAPEHLEIVTAGDESILRQIRNAGSIFLGEYSPVVVGDYFAGPNHVLPTNGTARFASPLSVETFVKRSSVVKFSRAMMKSVSEPVARFAEHEGLTAHALSARLREREDA
ncbi:MAG TPA: histidinol dehydrogenase [Bacteroidota bacterium]|nr:histidinol dehydrogenase [Bacteroidota bacterium]